MTKTISFAIAFTAGMMLVGCANQDKQHNNWKAEGGQCAAYGREGNDRLLGHMISGSTQSLMDQNDEGLAHQAARRALDLSPDGGSQYWRSANTDKYGESRVLKTMDQGRCRELSSNVFDNLDMPIGQETVTYCKGHKHWHPKKK